MSCLTRSCRPTVWTLPGENQVSGDVIGVDGIFERFAKLAGYGVNISIEHVTVNAGASP